ncbi:MAG: hypothetical protein JWM80_79 [Cyanobacteria bacterium RYN_339]|nr:hypothetical protein [Cyanobacteria bacterium RYN_339]
MGIAGAIARLGALTVGREVAGKTGAETIVKELAARDVLGKDVLKLTATKALDDRGVAELDRQIEQGIIVPGDDKKIDVTKALFDRDAPLYADQDLYTRAHDVVGGWVAGGKKKVALREAYTRVAVQGNAPAAPIEQTLVDMLTTRRARWERLATREHLPMPEAFKLYRGVDGEYAVKAVMEAWGNPAAQTMEVPLYDLTSWSLRRETADAFALQEAANVIYQAEVPFGNTVADKYVDGGAFIRWCYDQDEVVVGKPRGGLQIPVQDATVQYQGKTYTYADRQALAEAWKKDHP